MAVEDPFASAPADDEAQTQAPPQESQQSSFSGGETKTQATTAPAIVPQGDGKWVLTFKGGTGYDAPWIVYHANTLDEALEAVSEDGDAAKLAKLMERTQVAGKHFASQGSQSGKGGGGGKSQSAPKAAQEAPNGEERFCRHGKMNYRSGTSKAGKAYEGFFCASGDRNDECKAQFLR